MSITVKVWAEVPHLLRRSAGLFLALRSKKPAPSAVEGAVWTLPASAQWE
jgi:hypothetical protein